MTIDLDLVGAEFEKWQAECDVVDEALAQIAENPGGLTVEQLKAAFLDLIRRKTEAGERLLAITRALEAHQSGKA